MKKTEEIRNIDSLEREIYRLRLEAESIRNRLDKGLDQLQENYSAMAFNSLLSSMKKEKSKKGFFFSFIKNEAIAGFINRITCHIGDRVMENIDGLIDRAFHRKK